jgi:hypothetical protein
MLVLVTETVTHVNINVTPTRSAAREAPRSRTMSEQRF